MFATCCPKIFTCCRKLSSWPKRVGNNRCRPQSPTACAQPGRFSRIWTFLTSPDAHRIVQLPSSGAATAAHTSSRCGASPSTKNPFLKNGDNQGGLVAWMWHGILHNETAHAYKRPHIFSCFMLPYHNNKREKDSNINVFEKASSWGQNPCIRSIQVIKQPNRRAGGSTTEGREWCHLSFFKYVSQVIYLESGGHTAGAH